MGDFNWITPSFLAFASPQHSPTAVVPQNTPEFAALPSTIEQIQDSELPVPFKNVLTHFSTRNVGLVVRLNSELYSPSYFTALGINHIDMIFEDGTCPPPPIGKAVYQDGTRDDHNQREGNCNSLQGWSRTNWLLNRGVSHLSIWIHCERNYCIYALHAPGYGCWAATALAPSEPRKFP